MLPSGEILGFLALQPPMQNNDLSAVRMQGQIHTSPINMFPILRHIHNIWLGIHQWRNTQMSNWSSDPSEVTEFSNIKKTMRAIKTFKILAEGVFLREGTCEVGLNLVLKEIDYILLLITVHGLTNELEAWLPRLNFLFNILDPHGSVLQSFGMSFGHAAPNYGVDMGSVPHAMPAQHMSPTTSRASTYASAATGPVNDLGYYGAVETQAIPDAWMQQQLPHLAPMLEYLQHARHGLVENVHLPSHPPVMIRRPTNLQQSITVQAGTGQAGSSQ